MPTPSRIMRPGAQRDRFDDRFELLFEDEFDELLDELFELLFEDEFEELLDELFDELLDDRFELLLEDELPAT